MKYQKKPEFVEAVQWTGEAGRYREIKNMCTSEDCAIYWWEDDTLGIYVGHRLTRVNPGKFVVKNTDGVISCCEIDAFEKMYEPLEPVNCDEPIEDTHECETISVEPCWQERMQAEYHELKTRYEKLHRMITKYEAGTLDFTPNCSLDLLRQQKRHMGEYLHDLEIRAEIEGVEL